MLLWIRKRDSEDTTLLNRLAATTPSGDVFVNDPVRWERGAKLVRAASVSVGWVTALVSRLSGSLNRIYFTKYVNQLDRAVECLRFW